MILGGDSGKETNFNSTQPYDPGFSSMMQSQRSISQLKIEKSNNSLGRSFYYQRIKPVESSQIIYSKQPKDALSTRPNFFSKRNISVDVGIA